MLAVLNRWLAPKAATGPGVYPLSTYPALSSLGRHPAKLMAEAQVLFHTNPWVAQAERAIYGRYVRSPWHLEDDKGDTVDPASLSGPGEVAYRLLTEPNDKLGRRRLWALTLRHTGLCGNAFWYLDQRDAAYGIPLQIIYINPARMTPVETQRGELQGWLMDAGDNPVSASKNLRGAVPFELDELRHFVLDDPDWGHYGVGIAEAAYTKIQLESLATRHASQILASGGRLAGIVAPKPNITISDDQWQAMIRDYRNIVGDPDSAKRLHIVKGPIDFTETAAKPNELELVDLMRLGREDVMAAWGVPLSQIGVMMASGLNSGEHVKFEEAALWQGPIEFRAGSFEEQVQSILNLFRPLGLNWSLVVDTPTFDDAAPLFDNAQKADRLPLTNNERRALIGKDPFEDEDLGRAVFIDKGMVRIDLAGEVVPEEEVPEESGDEPGPVKAGDPRKPLLGLRQRSETTWEPRIRRAVQPVLRQQAEEIAGRVEARHAHLLKRPKDSDAWWSGRWDAALSDALEPLLEDMARDVSEGARKPLGKADTFLDKVIALVRGAAGKRITDINATTRAEVARLVESGIEAGLSPAELATTIREASTFNEARAELIARTETMTAYNTAALGTYRELEVTEVEAIDGDTDDACAARNGKRYPLDEAMGISDHPNGTLDWLPVI